MAASPRFKVYTECGEYIGCLKRLEDAAYLVGLYGHGATVRDGHSLKHAIWVQGTDGEAADSYDAAAEVMRARLSP